MHDISLSPIIIVIIIMNRTTLLIDAASKAYTVATARKIVCSKFYRWIHVCFNKFWTMLKNIPYIIRCLNCSLLVLLAIAAIVVAVVAVCFKRMLFLGIKRFDKRSYLLMHSYLNWILIALNVTCMVSCGWNKMDWLVLARSLHFQIFYVYKFSEVKTIRSIRYFKWYKSAHIVHHLTHHICLHALAVILPNFNHLYDADNCELSFSCNRNRTILVKFWKFEVFVRFYFEGK